MHVPAFLWVSFSFQLSFFLTYVSGHYTSISSILVMGKWRTDYHIVWAFEHLSAWDTVRIIAQFSLMNSSRTDAHDPVSCMLWTPRDQRLWELVWGDTAQQKNTHVPQWLQENMKALVEDSLRRMSESLWIPCHSFSSAGFTLSAHLRRRMLNRLISVLEDRQVVPWDRLVNEGC